MISTLYFCLFMLPQGDRNNEKCRGEIQIPDVAKAQLCLSLTEGSLKAKKMLAAKGVRQHESIHHGS